MTRPRLAAATVIIIGASIVIGAVAQYTTPHTIAVPGAISATLGSTTFVNQGLVGVGRLSASRIDPFGDSLGSASGLQITNWTANGNGTYNGVFHLLPDRGYNTGTFFADFAARINSIGFTFTPYTGTAGIGGTTDAEKIAAQNQIVFATPVTGIQFTYDDPNTLATSLTTGLDPAGIANTTGLFGSLVPYVKSYTGAVTPGGASSTFSGINKLALDAEALVLRADGSGYVGDEYGPAIYYFNAQKKIVGAIMPPDAIQPHLANALNFTSTATPDNGRRNNQGLEGVGLSPDGTRLFALLQSAAVQDSDKAANNQNARHTRLLVYDVSSGPTPGFPVNEYVLTLPTFTLNGGGGAVNRTAAQSEVVALDNFRVLVLSRDGIGLGVVSGNPSMYKSVLLVDTRAGSPTDIAGAASRNAVGGKVTTASGVLDAAITPLSSVEVVNILNSTQLGKFNIALDTAAGQVSKLTLGEKWEGMSLVPAGDAANPNDYFLFIANDNDFLTSAGRMHGPDGTIISYNGFAGYPATRLPAAVNSTNNENDTVFLVFRITLTPDPSAPIIVPAITGALGTNGWYRSNVQVSWSVTDPQSGIATSTGCGTTTLTTETAGLTLTCTATNTAGLAATASVNIKLDKTPPAFTGLPRACSIWPPNGKMVDVAVISASDTLSGLLAPSFAVTGSSTAAASAASDIVIGSAGSSFNVALRAQRNGNDTHRTYTLVATATDRAGNVGTQTATCVVPHDQGK